jgi:hypothetical protein
MSKYYRWERLTGSGKVSPDPVTIGTIIVTATTGSQGEAKFYDGESAGDPELLHVHTLSGDSKVINFEPGLHTLRGLYIDLTSGVDEVMICYDLGEE